MPYSLELKPRPVIAYGPDGRRIFNLSELPSIEVPKWIRITPSYLEIDGYYFPYDCFQTKAKIWIQKMWTHWAYHPDMREHRLWVADLLGELEKRFKYWQAEFSSEKQTMNQPQ